MIAIDWGTSSFRAYRLADADGTVLDRREAALGILAVKDGAFAATLETQVGDWIDGGESLVLTSGMIGSRQGWREAPYVECPADAGAIAAGLMPLDDFTRARVHIVPGISCRDASGVPDVARGEETQAVGAMAAIAGTGTVCLPGTHSKYFRIVGERIESFATHMTGEVYAVLRGHSILGRLMPAEEGGIAETDAAFAAGVARSGEPGGLLHHVFAARTRGLFDELAPHGLAPYLSGMLIGHEIRSATADGQGGRIAIIANPRLAALYQRAFALLGRDSFAVSGEPVVRGLWRIAHEQGLLS